MTFMKIWSRDTATPTQFAEQRLVKASVPSPCPSPCLSSPSNMSGAEAYHQEALRRQRVLNRSAQGIRETRPCSAASQVSDHAQFLSRATIGSAGSTEYAAQYVYQQ